MRQNDAGASLAGNLSQAEGQVKVSQRHAQAANLRCQWDIGHTAQMGHTGCVAFGRIITQM
jgi:hypothetical protein